MTNRSLSSDVDLIGRKDPLRGDIGLTRPTIIKKTPPNRYRFGSVIC